MTRFVLGLGAAATFWGSAVSAARTPAALPLVQAERAFAAAVKASGVKQGFLAFAAKDGIMFLPRPTNAARAIAGWPDKDGAGPPLFWWPLFAGISLSGDLGFTTGGVNRPTRYFTVWQKQPDGGWKWIYDGGTQLSRPIAQGSDAPIRYLRRAGAAAGSAKKALAEIAPLEADLSARAAKDVKAAFLHYLSEDGLAAWSPTPNEPGRTGQSADLSWRPVQARLTAQGGTASAAGDLAFTYGEARWSREATPGWGHYARIWQKRREGWRLVSDVLVVAPGDPPASSVAAIP
jgi:ketosteroid isomerase-like protein